MSRVKIASDEGVMFWLHANLAKIHEIQTSRKLKLSLSVVQNEHSICYALTTRALSDLPHVVSCSSCLWPYYLLYQQGSGCCLLVIFVGFSELVWPSLVFSFPFINESTKAVYTSSVLWCLLLQMWFLFHSTAVGVNKFQLISPILLCP